MAWEGLEFGERCRRTGDDEDEGAETRIPSVLDERRVFGFVAFAAEGDSVVDESKSKEEDDQLNRAAEINLPGSFSEL